jgi:GMP synthase-like glutamine amidotransferase
MRALAIVHQRDAGPGVFADVFRAGGVGLDCWTPTESRAPPQPPEAYDAVLVLGGAMHADQDDHHPWLRAEKATLREMLAQDVPLLGVCLGAQLLAEAAGAAVRRARRPEIGWRAVEVTREGSSDPVLGPLAPRFEAFQWHSYEFTLAPGATALATSDVCLQAYRLGGRAWGIQFHAEVSRADAESWIDDYRNDEDAMRVGLDPEALRRDTDLRIGAWNDLGRSLSERFFEAAATRG